MSDETTEVRVEEPESEAVETQESAVVEEIQVDEDAEVKELLSKAINEDYRKNAEILLAKADKKIGIVALEGPNTYTPGNLVEEIIHYMRWEPGYLFDCDLEQLHEYEMCLSAHIVYVKAKENHWGVMCDIAKRELKRAIKLAAVHIKGKSVGEREALAMHRFPELQKKQEELDIFNLYREKCHGISDTLIQMDNSLKKTCEKRKSEYYTSGRQNKGEQQ